LPAARYELAINDKAIDDLVYRHIKQLEVEDSETNADSFVIRLSAMRQRSGLWSFPAKDKFQLFSKVRISASFPEGNTEHLIEGYITHIDFHIDKDETKSYVDINGIDATVLMNLQEKLVAWEDKSDSEIAKEIFDKYGFDSDIEDTAGATTPQSESNFTTIQRETDIEFLKRLAARNGFDCFLKKNYEKNKTIGYFRKRKLDLKPQKDLAVQFGPGNNNVESIDFTVDALRPLSVEIRQKDAFSEEVKEVTIEDSKLPKIGKQNLQELVAPNIGKMASGEKLFPKIVLSRHVTSEQHIMETEARSVFDDGSWFITAKGTVNAEVYGRVLNAKSLVLIKGADEDFSGKYYVTKVVHKFKPESYVQEFEAKKNALGLEGSESFERGKI
jgi:phage protein D